MRLTGLIAKQAAIIISLTLIASFSAASAFSKNLDPSLPPSGNFELIDWKLSIPTDEDGNGRSDSIKENVLAGGYTNKEYFFTKKNGGMAFRVPVGGYTTPNSSYSRVELREMLRRGDSQHGTRGVGKNNWVFSSAPAADQAAAGGVDGKLTGTVSIDHVTTTGIDKQVGRVVFAQIHAGKDEPVRLHYRKLPNNSKGSIYFAHEPLGKKDVYYNLVGSRSKRQENPEDGVALGEKFSYEIKVVGNTLTVKLFRSGKATIAKTIDMSGSGFDQSGQYHYFKAGAYMLDRTAKPNDYAEVVYYALDNTH
jgi:poly(beta-D-mannuronate) lyase